MVILLVVERQKRAKTVTFSTLFARFVRVLVIPFPWRREKQGNAPDPCETDEGEDNS